MSRSRKTAAPESPAGESPPERISKEEVNQLPRIDFEGEVVIVSSDEEVPAALARLRSAKRLGFDTETRPVFRKADAHRTPALLQLATEDYCALFQLKKVQHLDRVFAILADPSILKTGVAVRDDLRALQVLSPFEPQQFLDLSRLATDLGVVTVGLRNLTAIFMGGKLSKRAQLSNWESSRLSREQIRYAATDAWVSLRLYEIISERHRLLPDPEPIPLEPPQGLDHINLVVRDMDRSVDFYTRLLGFRKTLDCPLEGTWFETVTGIDQARARCVYLELDGNTRLELLQFTEPTSVPGRKSHRRNPLGLGFRHLALTVDDIEDSHRQLKAAGVRFRSDPVEVPLDAVTGLTGRKRLCYFEGPDGEVLELAEYRPA